MNTLYYASVNLRVSMGFYRGPYTLIFTDDAERLSFIANCGEDVEVMREWDGEAATRLTADEFCRTTLAELRAAEAAVRSTPLTAP